ncbi:MAG TPA: hypothetical protein PLX97_01980, partial [Gemmatales bacterium]|nr:hypothetical protein [Gemmatales bacterium]
IDGDKARQNLWEKNQIKNKIVQHLDGPYFRVSTHIYNSEAEIKKLASLIPEAFALAHKS